MPQFVLDYLELSSSSTALSSAFYSKAFGWTSVAYGDTYSEIRGAGLVFGIDGEANESRYASIPVIRTDDLDAAYATVLAAGAVITREPYDFPGGRRFLFREPGGTEFAIYVTTE